MADERPLEPPIAREAFFFKPDWGLDTWVAVVLAYLEAFEPGAPVMLMVLSGELPVIEAEAALIELAMRTGHDAFADIGVSASAGEALQALGDVQRAQWVRLDQPGASLVGTAGSRFARCLQELLPAVLGPKAETVASVRETPLRVPLIQPPAWDEATGIGHEIGMLDPERGIHLLRKLRDALMGGLTAYERYQAAEALSMAVYPTYKFSDYNRIFLEDQEFMTFYQRFMDPDNWHSLDRKYTLRELLKLVKNIPGDIAECGTYKGFSAYLMCEALQGTRNLAHLFDSFEGLSDIGEQDGTWWSRGSLAVPEKYVRETLSCFQNYRVYKGWIPERFSEVAHCSFRFVHIDVDIYQPTRDALAFFYPRVPAGGILLLDDHGSGSCPGAKAAADEFMADKSEPIVLLTTGQAFILKK